MGQMCFAGHIIVASAKTNKQVIAGLAVSGFGGANCQVHPSTIPGLKDKNKKVAE